MAIPESRRHLDKIATPGRESKNVLFVNILEASKLSKLFATEADKQFSDTRETFICLRRSYITVPVSRPLLDKKATPERGSKNVLFVNILEARKLNNLSVRYLQVKAKKENLRGKARNAYLKEKERKKYLQEKETAAMIKQAVIQALIQAQTLKKGVNPPTKNKGAQQISSNRVDSRIRLI